VKSNQSSDGLEHRAIVVYPFSHILPMEIQIIANAISGSRLMICPFQWRYRPLIRAVIER
jgi:hypothetical protein